MDLVGSSVGVFMIFTSNGKILESSNIKGMKRKNIKTFVFIIKEMQECISPYIWSRCLNYVTLAIFMLMFNFSRVIYCQKEKWKSFILFIYETKVSHIHENRYAQ